MTPPESPETRERELARLRAENRTLTAERDQLRMLFNSAPAVICSLCGPEHVFEFVNPPYQQLIGGRDVVGMPIRQALPEIEGQGFFELLDQVYRTGEPFVGNEMLAELDRHGTGELDQAYFNFVYSAIGAESDGTRGILVHAVEVTEMVRARQLVQRSEDRFRSLVRATSQLVWMTDAAGRVEEIPEWCAYTGQSPEAARGYGWLDALHPEDRGLAEEAWRAAVAARAPYEAEYRIRNHEGHYRLFAARGTPVLEADGSVREWVGLCTDIEDQRRIQKENERIFSSSLDVICTIGADGYIKRMNGSLSRILGHSEEALLAQPYWHFIHPDDAAATAKQAEALAKGGTTVNFENRYLAADGSIRWLNWMCTSDTREPVFYCIARDVTSQREAAAALRDREVQYAMVMKATQDAIWDWNLLSDRLVWNEGVETLFQYRADQVEETITWWYDNIHPEDAERVVEGIHAVIDHGGQHWSDEYRFRRADGTYAVVVDRGYCIHDEAGKPVRMVGAMHDVTRLREAEEVLKASEARFRQLADTMPQMIFTAEPSGDVDYFNQRWYDYTGMTFEESRGWNWKPVHHPEDLERVLETWSHCVATGDAYTIEYQLKRKDGEYRWHLGRAVPVRDDEGRIVKWFGTNTEIHDQKMTELALQSANETLAAQQEELAAQQEELQMQTEELQAQQVTLAGINTELRASEARFRHLANAMPQIVWASTPEGFLDYYNDRTSSYTGVPLETLVERGWEAIIHPEDVQPVAAAWTHSLETGEPLEAEFRVLRGADGEYRWHIGRALPTRDESGRVVRWHGTATDIHDQKRTEEALKTANEELVRLSAQARAANKMKSEFLANMSHELRTPLNSIIGYTELVLMLGQARLDETGRGNLEVVLRNARHLLSLINDVLDLSKIEAGKATVYPEPFDPRTTVEAVLGTAEPLAREKGLRLAAHVAPGLGQVVSDETKVRQILLNLVSNAVKFTKEGSIDIHLEPHGDDAWSLRVSDTGIGIAAEHQALVFEEFRQVDASSTRTVGGTGLGLSIARGLARLLGGELSLRSAPGQGSTFTLVLPRELSGERHVPAREPVAGAPAPAGRGRVVVAIDDDPEALRLLMTHLKDTEYAVAAAPDGETGLKLVRELSPVAVTLDVLMPGLDGWAVLQALKADPKTAGIPVLILSFVDNKALGFSLGAAAYLTKPVEREQLLTTIRGLAAPTGLDRGHVLVVEDAPEARAYYRQLLEAEGLGVLEAADGQAAIALLEAEGPPPALVLLDLTRPGIDGFGVLARLRADARTREVPVVVVTGRALAPEDMARLGDVKRVVDKDALAEQLFVEDLRSLLAESIEGTTPEEVR